MSSAAQRAKRKEELEHAYELQVRAATWGALKYTTVGISLASIAHVAWPTFRRQTLPFKCFLVSAFTMFGLVLGADNALLSHEKDQRRAETALRREARIDLAKRGLVGTETEIAKWKEERLKALGQQQQQQQQQSDPEHHEEHRQEADQS